MNSENTFYKENDLVTLNIKSFNKMGLTISNLGGKTVEILGGIPQEKVEVRLLRIYPDKIISIVNKVIESSKHRVNAPCVKFLECTGCQWQHIEYKYQLILKKEIVVSELKRYEKLSKVLVNSTLPSINELNYRNHSRFTVRSKNSPGEVGFINSSTRKFVKINECLLMNRKINSILAEIQDNMDGFSQVSIRGSDKTSSFLVQPNLIEKEFSFESGQTHYLERIFDREYNVASPSFFQVNISQLENIINISKKLLDFDGSGTLVDAYSGVGVFGSLFSNFVDKVICIEESASATIDGIKSNGDLMNIQYVQKKTEHALLEFNEEIKYLILDPPRVGCHIDVLKAVKRIKPSKILMISCDPASMMRDLNILVSDDFYSIDSITPIDMFPQTRHIECVAILKLKNV